MKLTIGKKLTLSFIVLALLVLLSGIIGIMVLNNVSGSADTVAKEKVPIQYSIMKADRTVVDIEKHVGEYIHSSSGLVKKEKELMALLDEFDMWISMLEHGSFSDKFIKSKSYNVYKKLQLDIQVPPISQEMLKNIDRVLKQNKAFRKGCTELIKIHNEYLSYSVTIDKKSYDLPSYIMLLQNDLRNWFNTLGNSVISAKHFDENTDPNKGMIGTWLRTYKVEDKGLNKLIKKIDRNHKKLFKSVKKINQESESKGKSKFLVKSQGATASINQYFGKIYDYITPIYQEFDDINRSDFRNIRTD